MAFPSMVGKRTTLSKPLPARTARKRAGTETRPFLSILLTYVDKNRAIQPTPPSNQLPFHPQTTAASLTDSQRVAQNKHFWRKMDYSGISWDIMEVNGKWPHFKGFRGLPSGKIK